MKLSMRFFSVIGILIFAYILFKTEWPKLLSVIENIKMPVIYFAIVVIIFEIILRAYKWQVLANIFSSHYYFKDALETYLIGVAFGAVTPSQSGDLVKSFDLEQKTKIGFWKSFSLALFDKIMDLSVLLIFALVSVVVIAYLFIDFFKLNQALFVGLVILCAAILVVVFLFFQKSGLLQQVIRFFLPAKYSDKVSVAVNAFYDSVAVIFSSRKRYLYIFLTFADWFLLLAMPWLYAYALGLDVSMWYFVLFMPIVTVVMLLPISVLGLGTREGTLILLFSLIGISSENMLVISMIMLFLSQVPQVIAGYIVAWYRKVEI